MDIARPFAEKHLYAGTVLKQEFIKDSKGTNTLVLNLNLDGQLVNDFDPEHGLLECPKVKVEVRLAFPDDNDERYKYALRDLISLGYAEDDLEALNPANRGKKGAKFFELEGRTVYVTPSYKTYTDRETVFWNMRFPKGRKAEEVPAGALKKTTAERYKKLMSQLNEDKTQEKTPF